MKLLRALLLWPLKASLLVTVLMLGAWVVIIGDFGPELRSALAAGLDRVASISRASPFDPCLSKDPAAELDVIENARRELDPKMREAGLLLRQHQADIAFQTEQCRFIEESFPRDSDVRPAAQILAEMVAAHAQGGLAQADLERFRRHGGPTWAAHQERLRKSREAFDSVLQLNGRVQSLYDKLGERRLATLRVVPDANGGSNVMATAEHLPPDIARSRDLLESVHEQLFKTLYALDPSAVEDQASKQLAKSTATATFER